MKIRPWQFICLLILLFFGAYASVKVMIFCFDKALAPYELEKKKIVRAVVDGFSFNTPNPESYWTLKTKDGVIEPQVVRVENAEIDKIIVMPYFYTTTAYVGVKDARVVCYYIFTLRLKEIDVCGEKGYVSGLHDGRRSCSEEERASLSRIAARLSIEKIKLLKFMAERMDSINHNSIYNKTLLRDVQFLAEYKKIH